MTPQFAAGICSLFGGIFFFGAGYFFARYRLANNYGKLESEITAAREREDSIREKAIQDNFTFKRKIDMLKQKRDAYQKATQKRIKELKKQVVEMDGVIGDYRERLRDLAVEITRADSENTLLTEALETTKKDLKDISELERENQDLTDKMDRLNTQFKYLNHLKEENQRLTQKFLEQEKLSVSASSSPAEKALENKSDLPLTQEKQSESLATREGLEEEFESIVNRISQSGGSKEVVIADELGLLIAGTGKHLDGMAAMAAIYSMVGNKVTSLIPFGDVDVIKIINVENLTVTMQPLNIESEKLILTTLSAGEGPDRATLTRITEKAVAT